MTNKILLALIAAGLWANVIVQLQHPAMASPESTFGGLNGDLSNIAKDIHSLAFGICANRKLC